MECDPLLPGRLLPPDYAGRVAWRERLKAMTEAGSQMRAFPAKQVSDNY
jgi:DNA-binding transcriptional regulator PaaX